MVNYWEYHILMLLFNQRLLRKIVLVIQNISWTLKISFFVAKMFIFNISNKRFSLLEYPVNDHDSNVYSNCCLKVIHPSLRRRRNVLRNQVTLKDQVSGIVIALVASFLQNGWWYLLETTGCFRLYFPSSQCPLQLRYIDESQEVRLRICNCIESFSSKFLLPS